MSKTLNHLRPAGATDDGKKVTFLCGLRRKRVKGKNLHHDTCTACVTELLREVEDLGRTHQKEMRDLINLFPEGSAFEVQDASGELVRWDIHLQRGHEFHPDDHALDDRRRAREIIAAPWDI